MSWSWIGDWSERRASLTPKKEALIYEEKSFTYGELDSRANRLAEYLAKKGVSKGDRVSFLLRNCVECFDVFFATGKLGTILAPLNIRLSSKEMVLLAKQVKPKVFIYDPEFEEIVKEVRKEIKNVEYLSIGEEGEYEAALEEGGEKPRRTPASMEDPHLMLFTGGTTGLPKGAILSHRMIFWNSINTIVTWGITPEDVSPIVFPLFHTGGWNTLAVPLIHIGGKMITWRKFNPDDVLDAVEKYRCTIVIGAPTMFYMMVKSPQFEKTDLSSVRMWISGGAPCPLPVMEAFWNRGAVLVQGYGLTEAGPNNFYMPVEYMKKKHRSVGLPFFHNEVKLVNGKGEEVRVGMPGELLIRGPHTFSGYWEMPGETSKTIDKDGWVHTGDIVMKDGGGFYYIIDRKKDMYISGGENVYPVEIENIIYQHPKIAEVAVIGVPDEKWGEVGKAIIVPKPGETITKEEIMEFCKDRLAKYKVPKYVAVVESLPKSPAGKIPKKDLRMDYGKPRDEFPSGAPT
ncbi:MAG: acyl-CoA synthetase [Candidatus Jordarchaeum sp.]|uniref:acyl-CoA synthetase n=1 Tax=Candidatus Jordarchaeum sp. TaxID=2823881 RepID=UPI00404B3387